MEVVNGVWDVCHKSLKTILFCHGMCNRSLRDNYCYSVFKQVCISIMMFTQTSSCAHTLSSSVVPLLLQPDAI